MQNFGDSIKEQIVEILSLKWYFEEKGGREIIFKDNMAKPIDISTTGIQGSQKSTANWIIPRLPMHITRYQSALENDILNVTRDRTVYSRSSYVTVE